VNDYLDKIDEDKSNGITSEVIKEAMSRYDGEIQQLEPEETDPTKFGYYSADYRSFNGGGIVSARPRDDDNPAYNESSDSTLRVFRDEYLDDLQADEGI